MSWLKPVALAFQNTIMEPSFWHGMAWPGSWPQAGHRAVHHTVYGVWPYNHDTNMVMGLLYTITIIFFLNPNGTVWLLVWL